MSQLKIILFALVVFFLYAPVYSQNSEDAVIRITPNEFDRVYKVFFASERDYKTRITLTRIVSGNVLIDETMIGNGFMKLYSLKDAPTGTYRWTISYGNKEYTETFEVRSLNQLMKESISVNLDDLLNLTIEVQPYNTKPISIFFYNGSGEQLHYLFWEPKKGDLKKEFNLSDFDAYDIKVEILQDGDVQYSETFQTY